MKSLPLAVLLFVAQLAHAQPSTYPCTPGKVCRPASIVTPGNIALNGALVVGPTGTGHRISSSGSTLYFDNSAGASLFACGGGLCNYSQTIWAPSILSTSSDITAASYLRSTGVAFASFPTCNGGIAGALEYDTTNSCVRACNGSAWGSCLQPSSFINNYWSGVCFGTCSEDVNMTGGIYSQGGSTDRMVCSWGTAGSGGSTGVEAEIYDVTAGSAICSCNVGACNIAANTATACTCTGTYVSGNRYTTRLRGSTDCAVNPGNIVCTATVKP